LSTSPSSIAIITDSGAHFPATESALLDRVQIVPNRVMIAGRAYREGVDLDASEALRLLATQPFAPIVEPPTVTEFEAVFDRAARTHDAIISIHMSREINESWANGRSASQNLLGHCKIEVIDSGTLSTAQALLVLLAARLVNAGTAFDEVVRQVRSAVERVYSVYYVESADTLIQNKIMSPSHGILGTMLAIKPFLTVENGRLNVIEKVRTRIQAVERLVEYAAEFTDIDDGIIVQHKPAHQETTRMLHDRLAVDFPSQTFPTTVYGLSLAALIGTDATGLVILESEILGKDD